MWNPLFCNAGRVVIVCVHCIRCQAMLSLCVYYNLYALTWPSHLRKISGFPVCLTAGELLRSSPNQTLPTSSLSSKSTNLSIRVGSPKICFFGRWRNPSNRLNSESRPEKRRSWVWIEVELECSHVEQMEKVNLWKRVPRNISFCDKNNVCKILV